jgi:hypothetical protein
MMRMTSPFRIPVLCSLALIGFTLIICPTYGDQQGQYVSTSSSSTSSVSFPEEEAANTNYDYAYSSSYDMAMDEGQYDREHQRREMWDVWSLMVMCT